MKRLLLSIAVLLAAICISLFILQRPYSLGQTNPGCGTGGCISDGCDVDTTSNPQGPVCTPSPGTNPHSIQYFHDQVANPGDTIIVPAGTYHWGDGVSISKGITIKGSTQISNAGGYPCAQASPPTLCASANDGLPTGTNAGTVIIDDMAHPAPGGSVLLKANIPGGSSNPGYYLIGITFQGHETGQTTANDGAIRINNTTGLVTARINNCHFYHLKWGAAVMIQGWVNGVDDHNLFEQGDGVNHSHMFVNGANEDNAHGNGAWADGPMYGSGNFWFLEDNTIAGLGANSISNTSGGLDCVIGGRYVARHNYFWKAQPNGHGTEGGVDRGMRANQVYQNTFNWPKILPNGNAGPLPGGEMRSGSSIWHDNVWIGQYNASNPIHTGLADFRQFGAVGYGLYPSQTNNSWGQADGANPWDNNADPTNTAPPLYTGLVTAASSPACIRPPPYNSSNTCGGGITKAIGINVPLPSPLPQGLEIRLDATATPAATPAGTPFQNAVGRSAGFLNVISSDSTSSIISYYFYNSGDRGAPLLFGVGDTFSIRQLNVGLDQCGHGKGDLVVAGQTTPHNLNQQLEPCYSWNNVNLDANGAPLGFNCTVVPTIHSGTDYINYGTSPPPPLPGHSIPSDVANFYSLATNCGSPTPAPGCGAYTDEYQYPHPLNDGPRPPPPPSPTPTPIAGTPSPTPTATPTPIKTPTSTPTATFTPTPTPSATFTPTPTPTCPVLVAPSNLNCTTISTTQINLSWQNNSTAQDNIFIWRRTGTASFAQIATQGGSTTTSQDTLLQPNTTYDYEVQTHSVLCGDSALSNIATCTTVALPTPTATATYTPTPTPTFTPTPTPSATPSATPTATFTPTPTPTFTPTPTPTPTAASFVGVILSTQPTHLVGYWKCNETSGTTLSDSSGNAKDLSITGAIGTNYWLGETGEQGGCFRTDGVTGYASRNDSVILSLDNQDFTFYALVNGGLDFASGAAVGISNSASASNLVRTGQATGVSAASGYARGNTGQMLNPINGGVAFDNTWHSITFRRTGAVFDLYVDGVRQISSTTTLTAASTCNRTSLMKNLSNGSNPLGKGSIQHAAIWNSSLLDTEIASIQTARSFNPAPTPTATPTPTPTPVATPAAPSGLSATGTGCQQITLTWTRNSTNETGFNIQRSSGGCTSFLAVTQTGAGVTTYVDTPPTSGTFCYQVNAFNAGGNSGFTNQASATTLSCVTPSPTPTATPSATPSATATATATPTPAAQVPGPVQSLRVMSQGGTTNLLVWQQNDPSDAVIYYNIQRAKGGSSSYQQIDTVNPPLPGATPWYDATHKLQGRKTTFRVSAHNVTGDGPPSYSVTIQR